MVPLFDFAERQVGGNASAFHFVQQAIHVVGLKAAENHQRAAGEPHVDQGLLRAEAEAAGGGQAHIASALVNGFGKGVEDAFCAVAVAAGAHAHGDARAVGQQLGETGFLDGAE